MDDIKKVPAPWTLEGKGYILLYRFSKEEISKNTFLSDKFKGHFAGGFGSVMLVDYESSDAGPYSELLFIPGRFKMGRWKKHNIPKIYVSSMESVVNGRENWAIPKEQADFQFSNIDKACQDVNITKNNDCFFKAKIRAKGIPFPVSTVFLPFPLMQEQDNKIYFTKFSGKGWGRLASIQSLEINADYFPDLSNKKPLLAIKVSPFKICFPKAEIVQGSL